MAGWACPACSGDNPDGTRFCGHCGARAPAAGESGADVGDALRSFVVGTVADRLVASGGHLPEERRLITALFADISGFTALADRLDPEELLEVIDPIVSALSSVVGRYDGYVEKFAGDALLALFGAPVSHDDDAARALCVALEMHAELERMKAELPPEARSLALHVGVNSGHGIARVLGSEARMDYAVLGDAVILAQRLESAAPPGETYVSESTVRLAEHRFALECVGELTLKGKTEPVPAWRLVGERAAPARRGSARMVGRTRELALLGETFAAGGVVTITGEPGVGKSRLVAEARALAEEHGLRWLPARCLSYGASVPYWPFVELLRREGAVADPFVARMVGAEAGAAGELEPEAYRRGLHDAIGAWLAEQPSALVVEDAHWLDAASQALLAELARVARPAVLVVTARPEAEPVLAELFPERRELRLTPLDEQRVDELLASLLDGQPPRGLAAFIGSRAEGNPFFVQELVRSLEDAGTLVREDGRWRMRAGWEMHEVPLTVEEVVAGRMDRLSTAGAATLQTASVIGRRVPERLLAAVGSDVGAVDELIAAGFVHVAPGAGDRVLVFDHALVQDVAYERLLRKRRRDLHRLVAEQAEALYGAGDDSIDLLARHHYLGGGGPKAVKLLLRAAQRARRLYANEEAIVHLERCAELVPEDMELLLELADLHELVGSYERALELYERVCAEAQELGAWCGIVRVHRERGEFVEALAAADAAFHADALRGADLTRLWLEAGRTLSVAGHYDECIALLEVGLESAAGRRDSEAAQLLLNLCRAETVAGRLEDAVEHGVAARELAAAVSDIRTEAGTLLVLGDAFRSLGRLADAAEALREALRLGERIGSVYHIGGALINLGLVELEQGNVRASLASNERAIEEFERVGHGSGRAWGYSNFAWALANAERFDDALVWAEKSLAFSRSIGHTITIAESLDTLAFIALETHDYEAAEAHARDAADVFLEMGALPKAQESLGRAAQALELSGDAERAAETRLAARSLVAA